MNTADAGKQPQVPAQCANLTDELEKLAAKLGELEGRLECVLRHELQPDEPKSMERDQTKDPQYGLVPLANEIGSFCHKVAHLMRNIDFMITRLEV